MFNKIDTESPFRRNSMYERFEPDHPDEEPIVPVGSLSRSVVKGGYNGHAKYSFSAEKRKAFIKEVLGKY